MYLACFQVNRTFLRELQTYKKTSPPQQYECYLSLEKKNILVYRKVYMHSIPKLLILKQQNNFKMSPAYTSSDFL